MWACQNSSQDCFYSASAYLTVPAHSSSFSSWEQALHLDLLFSTVGSARSFLPVGKFPPFSKSQQCKRNQVNNNVILPCIVPQICTIIARQLKCKRPEILVYDAIVLSYTMPWNKQRLHCRIWIVRRWDEIILETVRRREVTSMGKWRRNSEKWTYSRKTHYFVLIKNKTAK